jgi:hypothetical protein
MKKIICIIFCCSISFFALSQEPVNAIKNRIRGIGGGMNSGSNSNNSKDTTKKKTNTKLDTLGFERRDDLADSIAVSFRFMDSVRKNYLDSSVNDFDTYFSIPSSYQFLGNNGAAAFPLIFKPFNKPGFDNGFHAFDIYKYTLENTKFYKTTGPFSALHYQLASGKEQMLQAHHTQNPRPNINFGFDYKLVSSPGYFVTQNTNHNSGRLFGTYQSKKKRYNGAIVLITNVLKASENGGIVNDAELLDPNKKQRFSIPVRLGSSALFAPNPFQSNIKTGNISKERIFFLRQSYDLGKRDSIAVNDSTTEFLFYPKLRLQHTLMLSSNRYQFIDASPDSAYYNDFYNIKLPKPIDTFELFEKWTKAINDFSLISFPDTKNTAQFLSAGITVESIKGIVKTNTYSFANVMLHGEYRNRTRNKLWDLLLKTEFYLGGRNAGNYNVQANVSRYLGKKLGEVNLFFNNVNRSPSFIFDSNSVFNFAKNDVYKNENIIHFGATSYNKFLTLGFSNYLITNYTYFTNFYKTAQYGKVINLLQFSASKRFKLFKNIFYYADANIQLVDNATPINVPFIFTRSRISYEKTAYKNLKLSTGIEIRYYTPYKANNYSPLLGQFAPQDTVTIKNKPDITAFFHFRIRGFTAFLRAENLNTLTFQNGFGFRDNNFAAPHYPTPGQIIRVGIKWWFVK